ncbi:hypothetical protein M0D73_16350, partial [Shewanella putrefaciens]|uniref:hypothetical protein n=1 Tax=unclassified Shewanella TaxID=196818 RepID=UPI0020054F70
SQKISNYYINDQTLLRIIKLLYKRTVRAGWSYMSSTQINKSMMSLALVSMDFDMKNSDSFIVYS